MACQNHRTEQPWLRAHDPETFVRRLDQEDDWVRKEIETALGAGSLVVPLLVEGAKAQAGKPS